jgi:hypothetical protein
MATQLWCCDFGYGFLDESQSSVEKHEELCELNPDNKEPEVKVKEDELNE